jgi:hypothetical protein
MLGVLHEVRGSNSPNVSVQDMRALEMRSAGVADSYPSSLIGAEGSREHLLDLACGENVKPCPL